MATNTQRLRAALGSRDIEQIVALLDERVVWRGLPGWDYGHAAEPDVTGDADDHDHADDDGDGHDHGELPVCTSRDEVRAVLEEFVAAGSTGQPVILAEAGDSLVVDPRPEPPLPFPLHQAFTFRGGRIVLIQDFPDRASALADLSP